MEQQREPVEADDQRILERHPSYKYPTDVHAKVERCRDAAQRHLEQIRQRRAGEVRDSQDHG